VLVLKVTVTTPPVPPVIVTVARGVAPSKSVTEPDGFATAVLPVTVTVKVTPCPKTDGFTDDMTLVVVLAFVTVNGSQALLAPALLASPLYVALKLNDPVAAGVNAFELGITPFVTVTVPAAVAVPMHVPVFQNW
jgi:hypothetical protein